jgi:hypothetical protein
MDVMKKMLAHSQFCMSGDTTLECAKLSVEQLAKVEDVDERIVVLVSDANLERCVRACAHHFSRVQIRYHRSANVDGDAVGV